MRNYIVESFVIKSSLAPILLNDTAIINDCVPHQQIATSEAKVVPHAKAVTGDLQRLSSGSRFRADAVTETLKLLFKDILGCHSDLSGDHIPVVCIHCCL